MIKIFILCLGFAQSFPRIAVNNLKTYQYNFELSIRNINMKKLKHWLSYLPTLLIEIFVFVKSFTTTVTELGHVWLVIKHHANSN